MLEYCTEKISAVANWKTTPVIKLSASTARQQVQHWDDNKLCYTLCDSLEKPMVLAYISVTTL